MIFIKIMISNYLKIKKEKDNPKFFKMILMDGKYILLKNQKMLYIYEKENFLNESVKNTSKTITLTINRLIFTIKSS